MRSFTISTIFSVFFSMFLHTQSFLSISSYHSPSTTSLSFRRYEVLLCAKGGNKKALNINLDFLNSLDHETYEETTMVSPKQATSSFLKQDINAPLIPVEKVTKALEYYCSTIRATLRIDCISKANEALRTRTITVTDAFYSPLEVFAVESAFGELMDLEVACLFHPIPLLISGLRKFYHTHMIYESGDELWWIRRSRTQTHILQRCTQKFI